MKRISDELGVEDIEASIHHEGGVDRPGAAYIGTNNQGQPIAAVAGWDIHNYPESVHTTEKNLGHVSVVVHELAHAVDHAKGNLDLESGVFRDNYRETYADSFRTAMITLEGSYDADMEQLIAGYDDRQIATVSYTHLDAADE